MALLITDPNISNPDSFYNELIEAHESLTDDESAALNARLILVLANQIGNREVLSQAIAVAKKPSAS